MSGDFGTPRSSNSFRSEELSAERRAAPDAVLESRLTSAATPFGLRASAVSPPAQASRLRPWTSGRKEHAAASSAHGGPASDAPSSQDYVCLCTTDQIKKTASNTYDGAG